MMLPSDARATAPVGPAALGRGAPVQQEPPPAAAARLSFLGRAPAGRRIRPNLFQRAMLRWRTLRPYSAVHAVGLQGALDLARLRAAIAERLQAMGLTGMVLERNGRWFRFDGGPSPVDLRVLDGGEAPLRVLAAEMEAQLNAPFPSHGPQTPFRFFVVTQADGFYLGLAYDHYIAGGESIVLLLHAVAQRYGAAPVAGASAGVPAVRSARLRRLFLRYPLHSLRALLGLPTMIGNWRMAARPPSGRGEVCDGVALARLDPLLVAALLRAANAWGVTLHDLFLAALLLALSPLAEARRSARRRTELAVSSIINLRPAFFRGAGEVFGQFLASYRASHPVPPGIDFETLAREVGAQTRRAKADKAYLQSLLAAALAGLAWRLLSRERRARSYAKTYAVWGGLTTLDADVLWDVSMGERAAQHPPLQYFRAVSSGPATPLVLAITAAGGALQVGVTCRLPDISREMANEVLAGFRRCLESVAR